jgi:hypothetical protein
VISQEVSSTLGGWIAHIEWVDYKGIMSAISYNDSLLSNAGFYK